MESTILTSKYIYPWWIFHGCLPKGNQQTYLHVNHQPSHLVFGVQEQDGLQAEKAYNSPQKLSQEKVSPCPSSVNLVAQKFETSIDVEAKEGQSKTLTNFSVKMVALQLH